ncbi:MAG: MmcQ/YjbR family DNA-binding protein [Pseudomonadota bacterium]
MDDWDDLVGFACALPGAVMDPFYGTPCPKVNGKAFVSPGREPDSFCLRLPLPEKELLIETDPETFWETDHYRGYPAVLVRYGRARDRVEMLVRRAWYDRLKKAEQKAFGERP